MKTRDEIKTMQEQVRQALVDNPKMSLLDVIGLFAPTVAAFAWVGGGLDDAKYLRMFTGKEPA